MRFIHQAAEVVERAVLGVDAVVVGDVVAVIFLRRWIERREPESVDAKRSQVAESGRDPGQVADSVVVRVGKAAYVDLVEDGVAPPRRSHGPPRYPTSTRRKQKDRARDEWRPGPRSKGLPECCHDVGEDVLNLVPHG